MTLDWINLFSQINVIFNITSVYTDKKYLKLLTEKSSVSVCISIVKFRQRNKSICCICIILHSHSGLILEDKDGKRTNIDLSHITRW